MPIFLRVKMGTQKRFAHPTSVFRMLHPPYFLGGFAMLWGYIKSMLQGQARFDDIELVKFIRQYQWACLLKGKARATDELNDRQAAVWKA